jgi:hypothetical protein
MLFQKRSSSKDHKYKFLLDIGSLEHTNTYTYLSLNIRTTGNFHKAVNNLRDKARRAFYAIKRNIKSDMPIRIWRKIVESVSELIAIFMVVISGVRSPTKNSQKRTNIKLRILQKHPPLYNVKM